MCIYIYLYKKGWREEVRRERGNGVFSGTGEWGVQACAAVVPRQPGQGRVGVRAGAGPHGRGLVLYGMSAHHIVAVYPICGILHGVIDFSSKY